VTAMHNNSIEARPTGTRTALLAPPFAAAKAAASKAAVHAGRYAQGE